MKKLGKSLLKPLPATLLGTLAGAVLGWLAGNMLALDMAQDKLERDAARVVETIDVYMDEIDSLLAALNHSPYPRCSQADMQYARGLVFHSEYIRDAGHMRNGRLECSAVLGPEGYGAKIFQPDIVGADGIRVYRNLEPYREPAGMMYTLAQGDSFVVRDPRVEKYMSGINLKFTYTVYNTATQRWERLSGQDPKFPLEQTRHDAEGRYGNYFYVTRCLNRYSRCITTWSWIPDEMRILRPPVIGCTLMGSLGLAFWTLLGALLLRHRQGIWQQLRRAIVDDRLFLVYQPIVDLTTRKIIGAEALARWNNREGLSIPPDIFVPLAEQHGFITWLTRWGVRRALADLGPLIKAVPEFQLSLNVSAIDLADPGFLPMLIANVTAAGVEPRSLAIEITERSTARGTAAESNILHLRDAGFSVHIDDFGTGYSSLSYLQDLAVDAIKIDRGFTHAVGTGAANAAVLPKVLAMAEALNLEVIVEGIETEDQLHYFVSTGQPLKGQGWLFGRPIPPKDFESRFREERQPDPNETEDAISEGKLLPFEN